MVQPHVKSNWYQIAEAGRLNLPSVENAALNDLAPFGLTLSMNSAPSGVNRFTRISIARTSPIRKKVNEVNR